MFSIELLVKNKKKISDRAKEYGVKDIEISKQLVDCDEPSFLITLDENTSFSETNLSGFKNFLKETLKIRGEPFIVNKQSVELTLLESGNTVSEEYSIGFVKILASAIPLGKIENRDLFEQLNEKLSTAMQETKKAVDPKKRKASSFWEGNQPSEKEQKLSEKSAIDENTLHEIANTIRANFPDLWESLKKNPEAAPAIMKAITDEIMNEVNKPTTVFGQS